jgi:hypothetical protein
MEPSRHAFLTVVLAAGFMTIAGCLGSIAGPTQNEEPTEEPSPEFDAFDIGEPSQDANPHDVTLWNDANTTRTITLNISAPVREETILQQSYTLQAGEEIHGVFREPAYYTLQGIVGDDGSEFTVTIDHFDTCNHYGTGVSINPDGEVETSMLSTAVGCPDEVTFPTPTSSQVTNSS